jgi:hypothetical protein
VFAWEDRAEESCRHNLARVTGYAQKHGLTI